jgi:hypothetical protein
VKQVNAKRLVISAVIAGLVIWALTEFFHWILADLIGAGEISRIAPALAGALLGVTLSALRQAIQKKREELQGTESPQT